MEEYDEYEQDIYHEYGEGFEEDLNKEETTKKDYEEPLDTSVLNSKKVSKYRLDDYFLVIE